VAGLHIVSAFCAPRSWQGGLPQDGGNGQCGAYATVDEAGLPALLRSHIGSPIKAFIDAGQESRPMLSEIVKCLSAFV